MSEDPNHRRPPEHEFAAMLESTIEQQRTARVEAVFVWPIIAWSVLGMGAIAYALYSMSRG